MAPAANYHSQEARASRLQSFLRISKPNIADEVTPTLIFVNLRSFEGEPVAGQEVSVALTGIGNRAAGCSRSNGDGVAICTFFSGFAEIKTVIVHQPVVLTETVIFVWPEKRFPTRSLSSGGGFSSSADVRLHGWIGSTYGPILVSAYGEEKRIRTGAAALHE